MSINGEEVLGIFPFQEDAYSSMIEFQMKTKIDALSGDELKMLKVSDALEYDEDRSARRLFRVFKHRLGFIRYGEVIYDGFNLYFNTLPDDVKIIFVSIFQRFNFYRMKSVLLFLENLKLFSDICKKYAELIVPGMSSTGVSMWMYFIDLRFLSEYKGPITPIEMDIGAFEWVSKVRDHTLDGSKEKWLRYFEIGLIKAGDLLLEGSIFNRKEHITKKEFSQRPDWWGLSGASSGDKLQYIIGNELLEADRTKWATALKMSEYQVMSILNGEIDMTLSTISEKRELGKSRAVISSNVELYICMSYFSKKFEYGLHCACTSLFYGSEGAVRRRLKIMSLLKEDRWIQLPIDQTEFDHQVNLDMINLGLNVIWRLIVASGDVEVNDYELFQKVRFTLLHGRIDTRLRIIAHLNGLLSGWRWTALLGTIINLGEFLALKKWLCDDGWYINDTELVAQGDDIDVLEESYDMAGAILWAYKHAGFGVNFSKNFVSGPGMTQRSEYLRLVAFKERTVGYLARSVPSILWRNPKRVEKEMGEERIKAIVTRWKTLIERGAEPAICYNYMVSDLMHSERLSYQDCVDFIHTPRCAGGAGVYPYSRRWISIVPFREIKQLVTVPFPPLGLLDAVKRARQKSDYLTNNMIQKWIGERVQTHIPDIIETIPYEVEKKRNVTMFLSDNAVPWFNFPPVPLKCIFMDIYNIGVFFDEWVRSLIEDMDWDELYKCCNNESSKWFYEVKRKCTHNVFNDWLKGKLPFSVPFIDKWSVEFVSGMWEEVLKRFWGKSVLGMSDVGRLKVVRSAYSCERVLIDIVDRFTNRYNVIVGS